MVLAKPEQYEEGGEKVQEDILGYGFGRHV